MKPDKTKAWSQHTTQSTKTRKQLTTLCENRATNSGQKDIRGHRRGTVCFTGNVEGGGRRGQNKRGIVHTQVRIQQKRELHSLEDTKLNKTIKYRYQDKSLAWKKYTGNYKPFTMSKKLRKSGWRPTLYTWILETIFMCCCSVRHISCNAPVSTFTESKDLSLLFAHPDYDDSFCYCSWRMRKILSMLPRTLLE